MNVTRAFRYELDPNNEQRTLLSKNAGAARFAWNWALTRRIALFEGRTGKDRFSDAFADHREWNRWKRENAPWTTEVSKCGPHEAFRDLDRAFTGWRRGLKRDRRRVGFPQFKRKGLHDSFRLTGRIHVQERGVQLPRLGRVRTKERTAVNGRVLSATVSREAERWFVSLTVEEERPEPVVRLGRPVGIDLGLNSFAVLSDGERILGPKPLARKLDRLKLLSKSHSRKEKGSRNKAKSARKLAKLHWRIRNQRHDFLHKLTTRLAKTKSAVVVEDLNLSGLVRNRRVSNAIADQGLGEFRRMLTYKAAWYGMRLIVASRYFPSSKLCSTCGHRLADLALNVREWTCPNCAAHHDRDLNAAVNLEHYGTASGAGTAGPGLGTPVDDLNDGGTAKAGLRVTGRRNRKRTPSTLGG